MARFTFTLQVPVEPPYQALARDVSSRFLEGLGAEPSGCAAFAREVEDAIHGLGGGAGVVDLTFSRGPAEVEVRIAADGRHAIVRHLLSSPAS
jgi:hypothetical protein